MANDSNNNIYFEKMFNNAEAYPGKIVITSSNTTPAVNLYGLLTSDFSLSSQNRWGALLPSIGELTSITQMLGSENVFSWIGASMQVWKGTDPLKFSIDMLLLNYKSGMKLEDNLKNLQKLTSMSPASGSNWAQATMAKVHGGYMADVFTPNNSIFNNGDYDSSKKDTNKDEIYSVFNDFGKKLSEIKEETRGVVTVRIGNKIKIGNLLVSRVDITPSLVEVVDPLNISNPKPLYYKVSVAFTGYRPLLSTDVDSMY